MYVMGEPYSGNRSDEQVYQENVSSWNNLRKEAAEAEHDRSVLSNRFYSEHHRDLDTGCGRERVTEYIWSELGEDYRSEVILDFQSSILEILDEKEVMRGKDLYNYVAEFSSDGIIP